METNTSHFPLSDIAYDLIVILHEKSKALKAYENYISDVQHDTSLRQALVGILHDEQRHIEILKNHLPRLLIDSKASSETDKIVELKQKVDRIEQKKTS